MTYFKTCSDAINNLEQLHGKRSAYWTYQNTSDEPVGVVVRFDKPDKSKVVLPISKLPGGWAFKAMSEPRPLYRLPEILESRGRVYVCEGEKCVDALTELGLIATTSAGGSGAANKTDWTPLAGREVVILPDADGPGDKYAKDVANILTLLNMPTIVKIAKLPRLRPGSGDDVVDYISMRRAKDKEDAEIRDKIEQLADKAESYATPEPVERKPILRWRPFPTHVLSEPLRSFVATVAVAIGVDECFVALPALAAIASAIGNTRRI